MLLLMKTKKLEFSQQECERLKNRNFFKRLIDTTILLAKSGKPFRGNDESINSFNQGMFKEISKLLIKYDPIFKKYMDSVLGTHFIPAIEFKIISLRLFITILRENYHYFCKLKKYQ